MSADGYKRAKEIFTDALEKAPGAERTAWLAQACAGDAPLRRRVETLLKAYERAGAFLEGPVVGQLADADSPGIGPASAPPTQQPGDTIGPYKLLEQIGEGGCGVVYMAEQAEPIRRKVALKVIKLGMDTKLVIARFEAERQALALMDHPNIARVLDAGATETGRPYFVMELVRGMRITDYCDENSLTTGQRLDLFEQVCHAVQHAHQKGIIHRDIKPSNILVTLVDGRPVPKVIDFGIAKVTGGQVLTDKTVFTAFEQFVGTPAYMSPEQAVISGVDVDTRSDIYSLGVLLYELLTGHTPFDPKTLLAGGLDAMCRMIREKEPPKPSTRLGSLIAEEQTHVAARRRTEAPRLIHLVQGDLDWIVMKCLEKERARRYATASDLVRDIEHHLRHEPVSAAAPGAGYRVGKFVRRHKTSLAIAGALGLLLAAAVVVSTWQAVLAARARRLAETREVEARENLWSSYLKTAQASLTSGRPGHRLIALESVAKAASIRPSPELRSAAANALGLLDLRTAREWEGFPPGWATVVMDNRFERYARGNDLGLMEVRRVVDDSGLHAWSAGTAPARFSPDGRYLAGVLCAKPPRMQVWDLETHRLLVEEILGPLCGAPDFHPTAPVIAMEVQSGRIEFLDFQTGRRWPTESRNAGTLAVRFRPNGKQLAAAVSQQPGVQIYEVDSGQLVASLPHSNTVRRVDWSPDGNWLAAPCSDGRIFVWNMSEDPRLHRIVEAHDAVVSAVNFDPQGEFFLSQSWDGTTALWSLPLCNLILKCPGFGGPISFSKEGRWLGPCVIGQTIQLLEVVRAPYARVLPAKLAKGPCNGAFSPDGRFVVLGGDNLQCWEVSSARRLWVEPLGDVSFLAFRPDGKRLLTKEASGACERAWTTDPVAGVPRLGPPKQLTVGQWGGAAQYSGDGSVLAIAQRESLWVSRAGVSQPVLFPMMDCCFVAVSPDGRWAAAANWNPQTEMRVWELSSGRPVYHITNANPAIAFTRDSRFLVKFWSEATECLEVGTWRSVARVPHRITPATHFAISPRNHWVAFHDKGSNVVQLSELPSLKPILTLNETVEALAFSPDDRLLLTRRFGGQVCICDLRGIRDELTPLGLGW